MCNFLFEEVCGRWVGIVLIVGSEISVRNFTVITSLFKMSPAEHFVFHSKLMKCL